MMLDKQLEFSDICPQVLLQWQRLYYALLCDTLMLCNYGLLSQLQYIVHLHYHHIQLI